MSNVINVLLHKLDPNEYRNLGTYPVIRNKVDALKASITTVGMWPSIIVRERPGGRYEKAFGHSRQIAAEELGMKEVPVIVMDLTDEQMVQYMGRENGEDYATDIEVLLNTWEAATVFLDRNRPGWDDIDAARLLGWMRHDGKGMVMNIPARTCADAFKLITAGHMSREDISGIPVSSAYNVVDRVVNRMEMVEKNAKAAGTTPAQRDSIKKRFVEGGKKTIEQIREGTVAQKNIRDTVDDLSREDAKGTKDELPMFRLFGKLLTDSIYKTLRSDVIAEKLQQVVEALPLISDPEDKALVRRIALDLGDMKVRADKWIGKLEGKKVVELVTGKVSS